MVCFGHIIGAGGLESSESDCHLQENRQPAFGFRGMGPARRAVIRPLSETRLLPITLDCRTVPAKMPQSGGVAERLNATVLKTVED